MSEPDNGRSRSTVRRLAVGLLLVASAGALAAVGGIHRETIVAAAAICGLALTLAVWGSDRTWIDPIGWLLIAMVAAAALQLVPIPLTWLARLAPASAATWEGARAALGQPTGGAASISVDPPSTLLGIIWLLCVTAAYLASWHAARRARLGTALLLAVPLLGVLAVAIGVIQAVLGAKAVLGIYQPTRDMSEVLFFSTFVNENHLAAFLNLGVPVALVQASMDDRAERRAVWGLAFVALAAGAAATSSRAGIATCLLGILIALGGRLPKRAWVAAGASALVIGAVVLFGPVGEELRKLQPGAALSQIVDLRGPTLGWLTARHWPWTGSGRGTFGFASTQVNSHWPDVTLSHAHDTPLQMMAEYGFVLGGVLVLALVAVGVHNLVDFNLDMLAVALPAALLAGVLRSRRREGGISRRVTAALGVGIAAGALALGAVVPPEPGPRRDAWTIAEPDQRLARSPSDYFGFLQVGIARGDVALLRHAHALHPADPATMLHLASRVDRAEALGLIRQVLSSNWRRLPAARRVLRPLRPTPDELLDVLPADPTYVGAYLRDGGADEALVEAALKRYPEAPEVLLAVAELALQANNIEAADRLGVRLIAAGSLAGYRVLGRVYRVRKQPYEAWHMYLEAGDPTSLIEAADAAVDAGRPAEAIVILDGARVHPRHFTRMKAIRERAVEALAKEKRP